MDWALELANALQMFMARGNHWDLIHAWISVQAELEWELQELKINEGSPGKGWEPWQTYQSAEGWTWIIWRRRKVG